MPGSFFDTNVLIYLGSGDLPKADRAETIISSGGTISVQVLNELANVARRKMRLSWHDTRAFLSIPGRHDVARRIDCAFLARLVAEHRLGESEAAETAVDLAYRLPKQAYRL